MYLQQIYGKVYNNNNNIILSLNDDNENLVYARSIKKMLMPH